MDAESRESLCGNNDNLVNVSSSVQAFVGNPSSAMNSIQTQRLNNQNCSDKLTQLINMSRDANNSDGNSGMTEESGVLSQHLQFQQQPETMSVDRRYNFNNRDMELSLSGSEEEEEDEEDENGQGNEGVTHQQLNQEQQHHDGDYGDIQFFHHKLLLQQHLGHNDFGIGSSVSSFGSPNGIVNIRTGGGGVDSFHIEECDDNGIGNSFSENPFVFPDNVMEYADPAQFFPGNCVGYLETILEETDEEFEEEEGCSGRHWWIADSDTDTDSVIRVDNDQRNQVHNPNLSTVHPSAAASTSSGGATTNLKAVENMEDLSVQSTFRSSASSRPFELEDLHLLDQLDLAFEETLMEPRRRSGFAAFGHQLHLLDQPLETKQVRGKNLQMSPFGLKDDDRFGSSSILQRSSSLDDDRSSKVFTQDNVETRSKNEPQVISYAGENKTDDDNNKQLGNAESKETFGSSLSPSSSDSEPHEVAEEDFFYSSPGSESEEGSSSDDSEKNGGVVLAEFSLSQAGGLGNNNPGMFGSAKNRRSFESPLSSSKLKSFRSFDSLNFLSGTEMLFSKADTFPSFHYIKEDVEPGSSGSGSPSSPRCNLNLSSSSTNDVLLGASETGRETSGGGGVDRDSCGEECSSLPSHPSVAFPPTFNKITKKNSYSSSSTSTASSCNSASGMMSTENLSEDSGIGPDGAPMNTHHPALVGKRSSESFSDEGPDVQSNHNHHPTRNGQEEESAKDYIAKTEFALNPMVFSSLSSADTNSNSPSMNSIPSLNTQEESPTSESTSDPENPDSFGEMKGKGAEEYPTCPTIYPHGVLNNDTTISHNSLLDSHLRKVDDESASLHTPDHPALDSKEIHNEQEGSNQIRDNPLEEKCPISINNASTPATIASINDDPPPIARVREFGLHPHSDSQIQTKSSISSPDRADEANTPGQENNKSSDNIRDKPNNPAVVASMESAGEKSNATNINTDVPLNSSSQLPSTLALTSTAERVHCENCKPQSQQISPEIGSVCHCKPDLIHVEPNTDADYLPKALVDVKPTNTNEDNVISASTQSIKPNKRRQHPRVGVTVSGGVPYIEEKTEMEEEGTHPSCKGEDGWNAKEIKERQSSSPSILISSAAQEGLEVDQVPPDYGHMTNVSDGYQYPYQLDGPYRRERSSSESEFESAESAVEEDSIALAYAIVNSPTKGSTSSSPTQELNGTKYVNNLDANVDSNRESGPVSTLMGLATACEDYYGEDNVDGMQPKERVVETCKVFASPSAPCVDVDNPPAPSRRSGTGQDGQSSMANVKNNENNLRADVQGMKNASTLLHHHHPEENYSHSTNPNHIRSNSTITYQVGEEAVGHELSRSVKSDNSSSADAVHHIIHQTEPPQEHRTGVDKHHLPHNKVKPYDEEDEPGLVIAKPIDPVHIGVAEVKKFSQLDSSGSRKAHHQQQTYGESDSETSRPAPGTTHVTRSKPSDEAILGHSNFGFFGRSSSVGGSGCSANVSGSSVHSLPPSIINLVPKTSVGSSSVNSTESSYGFPSPCPYPISETDLHAHEEEGQDWKEITSSSGANRRSRDQPKDQQRLHHLHLESNIKCGIRPEHFTIPLGAYTAAIIAAAPSIPSKRLVFVNEGEDQLIRIHEEPSSLKEKIGDGSSSCSSNSLGFDETSGKRNIQSANPPNGPGNASASSTPSSVPDILVVKQTQLGQGSDKKEAKAPHNNNSAHHNKHKNPRNMEVDTCASPISGGDNRRSTSPGPSGIPIKTRTYGARNEVEVVLVSSRTPSPSPAGGGGSFPQASSLRQHQPSTSSSLGEEGSAEEKENSCPAKAPRTRVHFSPVVSEISWRESYIDQSSEFSGSADDIPSRIAEVNNQGDCAKSGATTILPTSSHHRDNGGYHPLNPSNVNVTDSVVRPLNILSADQQQREMSHYHSGGEPVVRQPSPGSGKGPILVEKVQMRSSFLQGGDDDEDEDDELERKLTMDIHIADNRRDVCKSPVDEDYGEESAEDPHKEAVDFRTGASAYPRNVGVDNNASGVLDLYEDVSVEIQPINKKSGSTTLSMVPDLLSQCENATNAQTHIDLRIEEVGSTNKPQSGKSRKSRSPTPPSRKPEIPPPPNNMGMEMPPQQQIFPKIFAEDGSSKGSKSDSKNNSSSSLNKSKKTSKGFGLGSSGSKKAGENPKDKDNKETNGETEASKENKTKANKPGFFERLSKIRLSGGKAKKQKVHPKTDDVDQAKGSQPLRTVNAVNLNGNSTNTNGTTTGNVPPQSKKAQQPILKKAPANSPTPVLLNYSANDMENEPEANESHAAFENILDEIAGIKSIQLRMDKTSNGSSPTTTSPDKPSPPVKEMRSFAKRKQFYSDSTTPSPPVSPNGRSYSDLDKKLTQFKEETSKTRDVVSKSHPDLELIQDSVRQHSQSPEPPKVLKSPESKKSPKKSSSNSETGQKNEREWYKLLKSAAEKYYYRGSSKDESKGNPPPSFKTGIVETDLDTGASREMLDAEIVELDRVPSSYTVSTSEIPSASGPSITTTASMSSPGTAAKARSLTNLSTRLPLSVAPSNYDDDHDIAQGDHNDFDERARSYEFLLDDNQKSSSVPPENKLRYESRQLSEHELRIQRSLQRINVPEWFKNHETLSRTSSPANNGSPSTTSDKDKPANLKLLRRSEYGSSGGLAGGWAGLSAFKAPSMSSLQNTNGGRYSGSLNRSNFVRGRPATMSTPRLSKESLVGTGSASHSPSAFDRCSFTYGMPFAMTRFSGRMSNASGSTTPDSSLLPTGTSSYVKKPYLGWRSQERLNTLSAANGPPKLSVYLPPEERLAAELLKSKVTIRPPISDRPPLPKPPPRSDKTALTKTASNDNQRATSPSVNATKNSSVVTKINQTNSIPPPSFSDDEQSSSACREKTSDVHESIREVTKAISQYVAKGEEEAPKPQPRKKAGKKSIWIESSFVGRKPVSK